MLTVCQEQWPRLKNLMVAMFGAWLALFFVTHTFMKPFNRIVVPVLDLPLGFYLPVQAAMIVFAVTLFWFTRATHRSGDAYRRAATNRWAETINRRLGTNTW